LILRKAGASKSMGKKSVAKTASSLGGNYGEDSTHILGWGDDGLTHFCDGKGVKRWVKNKKRNFNVTKPHLNPGESSVRGEGD